jgi:lysozyme
VVETHYGKRPVVYVTAEFYRAHVAGKSGIERWVFWQFHDRGRRGGIRGPVDLDAFRGSINDPVAMTR